ncbi:MAG: polysaccharide deacetylase family protein [Victivallaceae bacterium]|nr:polysaccharide deacetylase family protein [Victivallaceae bacterium]
MNNSIILDPDYIPSPGESQPSLTPFLLAGKAIRPAVLVIPGGGYGCVCEPSEGSPIARRFNQLGFHAFVLDYRVSPHRWPEPQQDAMAAMRQIRARAAEWHVEPHSVAVCGFSAGAHLAASLGTLCDRLDAWGKDCRPDAMLLAYGVLSLESWSHVETARNLLGEHLEELGKELSTTLHVTAATPPAYVWHTFEDQIVPYRNSVEFAAAMRKAGRPCELHIFPHGPHGMQLGYDCDDIAQWPEQAKLFLAGSCGFRFPEDKPGRTVVLTFDDSCKSHLYNVAPILKKYGFRATFFICRFSEGWMSKNADALMTGDEIRQLYDQGFEIGNHCWTHPNLQTMSLAECENDITAMQDFLGGIGITPRCFAYPGGPVTDGVIPMLRDEFNFKLARAVLPGTWSKISDPYRLPSIALQHDDTLAFHIAVANAEPGAAQVLVFHGVPDTVHEHVTNSVEFFAKCMEHLYLNHCHVIGMEEYFDSLQS